MKKIAKLFIKIIEFGEDGIKKFIKLPKKYPFLTLAFFVFFSTFSLGYNEYKDVYKPFFPFEDDYPIWKQKIRLYSLTPYDDPIVGSSFYLMLVDYGEFNIKVHRLIVSFQKNGQIISQHYQPYNPHLTQYLRNGKTTMFLVKIPENLQGAVQVEFNFLIEREEVIKNYNTTTTFGGLYFNIYSEEEYNQREREKIAVLFSLISIVILVSFVGIKNLMEIYYKEKEEAQRKLK